MRVKLQVTGCPVVRSTAAGYRSSAIPSEYSALPVPPERPEQAWALLGRPRWARLQVELGGAAA
jgi:hypothetical protein